jgi:hypothetical protein
MAPVNIANQPLTVVRELRRQGVDVALLEYSGSGKGHPFGYARRSSDSHYIVTFPRERDLMEVQVEALAWALEQGFDIFHFWLVTFFTNPRYRRMRGLDLPFIKSRGRRIVYRGTGFDLRLRKIQEERNPHNPYRYGFRTVFDDADQARYLEFLKEYVDTFIVQDPEMREYMPNAHVVPRAIDLSEWEEVGIDRKARPLVVHAPSKSELKGTRFLLEAVEELQQEGVAFDFQLIQGMPHAEAAASFRRADIVVDQLVIGWYGVVTIEALALGKPVLVYVRQDLASQLTPQVPIANANPDTVKSVLRDLIGDYERRLTLAEAGRPFVEEVHEVSHVARLLRERYDELMGTPARVPSTTADLDHFQFMQIAEREAARESLARASALRAKEREILTARVAEREQRLARERELRGKEREILTARLAEQRKALAKHFQERERWAAAITEQRESTAARAAERDAAREKLAQESALRAKERERLAAKIAEQHEALTRHLEERQKWEAAIKEQRESATAPAAGRDAAREERAREDDDGRSNPQDPSGSRAPRRDSILPGRGSSWLRSLLRPWTSSARKATKAESSASPGPGRRPESP